MIEILNGHTLEAITITTFLQSLKKEFSLELVCSVHGMDPLYLDDVESTKKDEVMSSYKKGDDDLLQWLIDLDRDKMCWLVAYLDFLNN